jgi:low affinity Fe/Cu permease
MTVSQGFGRIANAVAHVAGKPITFAMCCAIIIVWAVTGPVFGYSDTWQLIINTGTTIITFLMVFLIQNTQNRDGVAIQTKLDELIRASTARNGFVGIEKLTEEELEELRRKCEARAKAELKAEGKVKRNGDRKVRQTNAKTAKAIERKVN